MGETSMKVHRGIILAAGRGERLVNGSGIPKPLVDVGGRTLIDRVLAAFEAGGLREAVVVAGYLGHMIRDALAGRQGIPVTVVQNDRWDRSNGVSVLRAASYIDRPCILSMADHLYDSSVIRALCAVPQYDGEGYLAVDDAVAGVFDIDDATKVRRSGDRILAIGKDLPRYDAIDTGVFRVGPTLVEALRRVYEKRGDCSLSDGVRELCRSGRMRAIPVTDNLWLDVDTPEALRYARTIWRLRERRPEERSAAQVPGRGDGRRRPPLWS